MACPMESQLSRQFDQLLSAESCLFSLKDQIRICLFVFTKFIYQSVSFCNSYCSLDNLMPKKDLYLVCEHGVLWETVRKMRLMLNAGNDFLHLANSFTFHNGVIGMREPLNFH